MTFVDVLITTLKTNPCFESKINMGYGVAMFRLLLLISCLGFVIGCGDESVSEPTVAAPTVVEPTVVEPTAAEPKVWHGDATEDDLDMLASERYTAITGDLLIRESQLTAITMPQLLSVGGYVHVHNNKSLTSIDLPQLQSVGGYVSMAINKALTTIDLSQLQSVGGGVSLLLFCMLTLPPTDCSCGKSILVKLLLLFISTPSSIVSS